jgi:hypothetical protein
MSEAQNVPNLSRILVAARLSPRARRRLYHAPLSWPTNMDQHGVSAAHIAP